MTLKCQLGQNGVENKVDVLKVLGLYTKMSKVFIYTQTRKLNPLDFLASLFRPLIQKSSVRVNSMTHRRGKRSPDAEEKREQERELRRQQRYVVLDYSYRDAINGEIVFHKDYLVTIREKLKERFQGCEWQHALDKEFGEVLNVLS